ncbi:hypothetical protein [Nocardioides sp. NPDC006303]|uniref:hypothetical protein n=1 Tax=Nocardioides sp. NPDC006303 TaxID=3156747 RepID=UPI0033BC284C
MLTKLRAERDGHRATARGLLEADDFDPKNPDLAEAENRAADLDSRIERLTKVQEAQRAADEMNGVLHRAEQTRAGQSAGQSRGLPGLIPSEDQLAELATAMRQRQPFASVETRALITTADSGKGVTSWKTSNLREPRRLVTVAGLKAEPVEIGGASGPRYGKMTPTAPTPEGGTKPEADAIDPYQLEPQTFARWTDVTVQASLAMDLLDVARWHAMGIALDEDAFVIDALTLAAGPPVAVGDDIAASVRGAVAEVEATVAAPADVIVCAPVDFAALAETVPANADDVSSRVATFSGARLYPSVSATPGTVLVAALAAVGRYGVALPTTTTTTLTPKTNVINVMTELISGFSIRQAGGVVAVAVAAPETP